MKQETHDVYARINSCFALLSPSEKRVARIILSDYPLSGLEPISKVARKAHVSDPTVLRFIYKLGYTRYADFQLYLKKDLDQRIKGPLAIVPQDSSADPKDPQSYFAHYSRELRKNIEETFNSISPSEVDAILEVFSNEKKRIHIMGGQFTEAIAQYLYFHLRKMRPGVSMIFGQTVSRIDLLLDLGKKDVLVVFDVRRYQMDMLELITRAAEQVDQIILITDEWLSPIAKISDHVLSCKVSSPSRWDSLVSMCAVVEALISEVMDRNWPVVQKRLQQIEEARDEIFKISTTLGDLPDSVRNTARHRSDD